MMWINIKDNKAGKPSILTINIVTTLIGIGMFNGVDNMLYPYKRKPLNTIFFKVL